MIAPAGPDGSAREAPRWDIAASGSVTRELLIWADRFPAAGDAIRGPSLWTCGGMTGNLAHAAARLGGCVSLAAAIGDDSDGEIVAGALRDAGVDTQYLFHIAGMLTPVVILIINPQLQRAGLVLNEATQAQFPVDSVPDEWFRSARVFFTDMVPPQTTLELAARARTLRIPVAYDLQMAVKHVNVTGHQQNIRKMFAISDYFFADRENFLLWRGGEDLDLAVEAAVDERPEMTVIITDGENGSSIYTRAGNYRIPAFPIPVVDTIGAGDAFHAAFLIAHLKYGWPLETSGLFASACAALSCRKPGGREGLPDRAEVLRFLRFNSIILPDIGDE